MNVLICDGTGTLTQEVAVRLSKKHSVRLMAPSSLKIDVEFVQGDIRNPDNLQEAMQGIEAVVYLPEMSREGELTPEEYDQEELDFLTRGTYNLMQAVVAEGVQRVIYGSTLEVFERCPEDWIISELYRPWPSARIGPLTRHLGELICQEFARTEPVTMICLRFGKIVREEEIEGKPFDQMWLDVRDAAQAVEQALTMNVEGHSHGHRWHRHWWLFHITSEVPNPRFLLTLAKQPPLEYEPVRDLR